MFVGIHIWGLLLIYFVIETDTLDATHVTVIMPFVSNKKVAFIWWNCYNKFAR